MSQTNYSSTKQLNKDSSLARKQFQFSEIDLTGVKPIVASDSNLDSNQFSSILKNKRPKMDLSTYVPKTNICLSRKELYQARQLDEPKNISSVKSQRNNSVHSIGQYLQDPLENLKEQNRKEDLSFYSRRNSVNSQSTIPNLAPPALARTFSGRRKSLNENLNNLLPLQTKKQSMFGSRRSSHQNQKNPQKIQAEMKMLEAAISPLIAKSNHNAKKTYKFENISDSKVPQTQDLTGKKMSKSSESCDNQLEQSHSSRISELYKKAQEKDIGVKIQKKGRRDVAVNDFIKKSKKKINEEQQELDKKAQNQDIKNPKNKINAQMSRLKEKMEESQKLNNFEDFLDFVTDKVPRDKLIDFMSNSLEYNVPKRNKCAKQYYGKTEAQSIIDQKPLFGKKLTESEYRFEQDNLRAHFGEDICETTEKILSVKKRDKKAQEKAKSVKKIVTRWKPSSEEDKIKKMLIWLYKGAKE